MTGEVVYQVQRPEVVKLHLQLVSKQNRQTEFILQRLLDAKAYPAFETSQLRAKANILRQQLLSNVNRIDDAISEIEEGDEIDTFLSSMKAVMNTFGLNREELIERNLLEAKKNDFGENVKFLTDGNFLSVDSRNN